MGVDMGTYDELIAHRMSTQQMARHFKADSLQFLSLEGMQRAIGRQAGYCNACFTGSYPLKLDPVQTKTGFEQAIA
jgi:amidophosphoribosyltransferase